MLQIKARGGCCTICQSLKDHSHPGVALFLGFLFYLLARESPTFLNSMWHPDPGRHLILEWTSHCMRCRGCRTHGGHVVMSGLCCRRLMLAVVSHFLLTIIGSNKFASQEPT